MQVIYENVRNIVRSWGQNKIWVDVYSVPPGILYSFVYLNEHYKIVKLFYKIKFGSEGDLVSIPCNVISSQ